MKIAVILAAGGSGQRLGLKKPKALALIGSPAKPLFILSLQRLLRAYHFFELIVAAPQAHAKTFERQLRKYRITARVVSGGESRAISVRNAFETISDPVTHVLIHDAARPCVKAKWVTQALAKAKVSGAVICASKINATVKAVDKEGNITHTIDRQSLMLAQTPQVFRKSLLAEAYQMMGKSICAMTDEASFFDGTHTRVSTVVCSDENIKITYPEDIRYCENILKREAL